MQVFDILTIVFGVMSGALLAAVPPQDKKNPSVTRIFALGVAIAGFMMIGAIAAEGGARFPGVLGLSLLGGVVGFASIYGTIARKPQAEREPEIATKSATTTGKPKAA